MHCSLTSAHAYVSLCLLGMHEFCPFMMLCLCNVQVTETNMDGYSSYRLDRIYPEGPYSDSNTVPCCKDCNFAKGGMDPAVWASLRIADKVIKERMDAKGS